MTSRNDINVIGLETAWIEHDALQQLERVAALPGMQRVAGMPDLHPGRGTPVGAAFFSREVLYPALVGNDIGCGMGLWQTDLRLRKAKLDRWEKKIRSAELDDPWSGDPAAWLEERGVTSTDHDAALGTVGAGNHFAEVLRVMDVTDPEAFSELGIDPECFVLLVHSGSRGLGEAILGRQLRKFGDAGLPAASEAGQEYLDAHDHAVRWAVANRELIAHRMSRVLGLEASRCLDVTHNSVVPARIGNTDGWLHRKGAAPADRGVVPIPGSRGSATYLVRPIGSGEVNCQSLAHGAGRRWKRSEAKDRLRERYSPDHLKRTKLGGRVVCDDRDLLYEEAPEAYKNIDDVIQAMVDAGIAEVIAVLHPVLTYKVSRR